MQWEEIAKLGVSLVTGSVVGTIIGLLFLRRTTTLQHEIRVEIEQRAELRREARKWKEAALTDLYGPLVMQLERAKRGFDAYCATNDFREAEALRLANTTARDLLLFKGQFVRADLTEAAAELVAHYDRWLEEYDREQARIKEGSRPGFIFAGPQGFPFPKKAEVSLRDEFESLSRELFGRGVSAIVHGTSTSPREQAVADATPDPPGVR